MIACYRCERPGVSWIHPLFLTDTDDHAEEVQTSGSPFYNTKTAAELRKPEGCEEREGGTLCGDNYRREKRHVSPNALGCSRERARWRTVRAFKRPRIRRARSKRG